MNILFIIIGLTLLIFGGDWLLKASIGISLRLKISKIVIGMTVVSFATSVPELIVSLNSALKGSADLALGNVIGSNIANLALVLAITILIASISVEKSFYKTDWPVMMMASGLLYYFIALDGLLERYEGAILFISLIIFLVYLLKFQKPTQTIDEEDLSDPVSPYKLFFFLVIGGLGLWGGSELLINGAVGIAQYFEVSERIIGITIVSIGTSVPELAASIIAIIKKEKAISLGNLVGSNVFNILAVLGITAMVTPISVTDQNLINSDIVWMLAISFLILPLSFIPKIMKFGWKEGLILISIYGAFMFKMFY
jgi:cation:H+ antiporter